MSTPSATPRSAVHFGVQVRAGSKHGLRMSRDTYAIVDKRPSLHFPKERYPRLWAARDDDYEDPEHRIYTDEWCETQRTDALTNYDLNMAFFARLDHAAFNKAVSTAIASQRGMVEVADLNKWEGRTGLYVMVLDDYRQAYVGVTSSEGGVKARIRQHWSSSKAFDRLLWGSVTESILSVDSFRALDTTRIYAARVQDPFALEDKLIRAFPSEFLLNRIMGGDGRLAGLASQLGADIIRSHDLSEAPE